MSDGSIKKACVRAACACALGLSLGSPVRAAGCSELFEAMAWAHSAELASGTSQDPSGAARDYQRWRSWALAACSWSLGLMEPTVEDLAVGARTPYQVGLPEGSSSCEALAGRLENRGGWELGFMIPHMQRAVDELALMDPALADAEAARLVGQERARAERRVAAGMDRR